jgi:hypothetical protein
MLELLNDAWILLMLSLVAALVLLPLVVFTAFAYDSLCRKYPKSPKILLMGICTYLATLIAAFAAYAYIKFVLIPSLPT